MSESANRPDKQPLLMTTEPQLDQALQAGWDAWQVAARWAGAVRTAKWLAARLRLPELQGELREAMRTVLTMEEADEQAIAVSELAELAAAGDDDLVVDTLWEGVLALGQEAGDADVIFEAVSQLAEIAERHGDPLAAAEFYVSFLNWRRQPAQTSEPEQVQTAFDEIIRLAEEDREPRVAALFAHRQAEYTRRAEADEEVAVTGDWEPEPAQYASWA